MATTIVDKHLARPKALEALLYLVEVGGASHVQIALALGAASKIVKTRVAALKALAQAVLGALALVLGLELRANAAACAAKDRRPQAPRPTVMAAATAAGAAGGEAGAAAVPPFDLLRATARLWEAGAHLPSTSISGVHDGLGLTVHDFKADALGERQRARPVLRVHERQLEFEARTTSTTTSKPRALEAPPSTVKLASPAEMPGPPGVRAT
eukprot:jgi/Chrpa1/25826/Chrysochromulina_OHIO_Genome00018960-RA